MTAFLLTDAPQPLVAIGLVFVALAWAIPYVLMAIGRRRARREDQTSTRAVTRKDWRPLVTGGPRW